MKALLPWATSFGTLLGMWLIGQKRSSGWAVGLLNQVVWVAFAVVYGAWGLLPLSAALTVIYTRALTRWRRDERGDVGKTIVGSGVPPGGRITSLTSCSAAFLSASPPRRWWKR